MEEEGAGWGLQLPWPIGQTRLSGDPILQAPASPGNLSEKGRFLGCTLDLLSQKLWGGAWGSEFQEALGGTPTPVLL